MTALIITRLSINLFDATLGDLARFVTAAQEDAGFDDCFTFELDSDTGVLSIEGPENG